MSETVVYIAAKYGRRKEMVGIAQELMALGYVIKADWLWGTHEALDGTDDIEMRGRWAEQDIDDIEVADLFLTFSEPPNTANRGGRHVEFGVACAMAIPIVLVGPVENVFHCLPSVRRFATWAEAKTYFSERRGCDAEREVGG